MTRSLLSLLSGIALLAIAPCVEASGIASGDWVVRTDLWGTPAFSTLTLASEHGRLQGTFDGDALDGSVRGRSLAFDVADADGQRSRYEGRIANDRIEGRVDAPDTNDRNARAAHAFSAWHVPPRPPGGPRTIDFAPRDFSNTWDADRAPVLVLWPGDTVRTKTIDSGGVDEHGVTRALFGNPQTGPFFIAGAAPGDTLVVRLRRLALNRDSADSLDSIVGRAIDRGYAKETEGLGKPVRWTLDRGQGTARPSHATGALAGYTVPVAPMLGGLAVAPGFGMPPMSTGDSGRFGGNMDWNALVEGNIVYLRVQQPGALLYLGDAHARQGDGETSQYALETSMDVTFSVDVIKGESIDLPRVESPTAIMALGQAGSLDPALGSATAGLVDWLRKDYALTTSEAAQVLGSAVQYRVANLAGRSVGVAAALDKALLPPSRHVVSARADK